MFSFPRQPAVGPTAYTQRISGNNNPDAPISNKWQDGNYISYGVTTVAIRYYQFKIESSAFNGKKRDGNFCNFFRHKLDSYSCRISFNQGSNLSLQFSQGFIQILK